MTAQITGISVGALGTVLDITSNGNHQLFTNPPAGYGLWTDGFPNPYRDGSGNTYLPIPHSENFRFRVPDWDNSASWVLEPPTFLSARDPVEGHYNNRHWLFGHWAEGNNVYALAHHEWYVDTVSSGGVPGFNNANTPPTTTNNHKWVNAITWASSSNGGSSFAVSAANNSTRCVLIPEPWGVQSRSHMHGFFHPTNIVKEGDYFYAAVEQRSVGDAVVPENGGAVGFCSTTGMSLIRTTNPATPLGWEYWGGSSWVTVNHATYQGSASTQVPHRFFQATNHNFYAEPNNFNSGIGHSIRRHTPSGQWVMFGFTGSQASGNKLGYTTSPTLANPQFSVITPVSGSATSDFDAPGGRYFAVFDPGATDQNFIEIGNTCTVLVARDRRTEDGLTPAGPATIRKGVLTLTVNTQGATYSIAPSAALVSEGQTITFTVTTLNFGSGALYWTNAGTTSGADFSDGAATGSVAITNNIGTFTRTLSIDGATESAETVIMQLRTDSIYGSVVAVAQTVTVASEIVSPSSGLVVRNSSNSGWLVGTTTNLKIRNANNTGWLSASADNFRVRNALNTGWLSPFSAAPSPAYQLTLARNDLDFVYASDVPHNGGTYITLDFVISFDDFFTAGADHIPICINAEITTPHTSHCGPITRNGKNLWSYGRGFFIRPGVDQVFAEHWNGTASPGVELMTNVGGIGFNPATHTQVRVRIVGGLRTGPLAEQMQIRIQSMDYSSTLFSATAPWGWDAQSTYSAAIGGIGTGFVSPNNTGCVEQTGPGANPTASATITDIVHQML